MMETNIFQVKPHGDSVLANRVGLAIIPALIVIVLLVYLRDTDQENAAIIRILIPFLLFGYGIQLLDWYGRALGLYSDLQLDDRGLTWRNSHWQWSELSAFALYDLGPGRRFIRFEVPEGESGFRITFRRFPVAPGRREIRISEQYDTPLEDIAAKLNETRDLALGGETDAPETSGVAGTQRIYFADFERMGPIGPFVQSIFPLLFFIWMIAWVARSSDFLMWTVGVMLLLLAAVVAITIAAKYRLFPTALPANNFLRLDDDGLTHVRRGKKTFWSWHEVSPFRVREEGWIWHAVITAEAPDDARLSPPWRWTSRILFRRRAIMIADIYLGRPDEIAATLNAYRRRAVGASGTPA